LKQIHQLSFEFRKGKELHLFLKAELMKFLLKEKWKRF